MVHVVEVALLMGLQASGKTTFYRTMLADTHAHVSKDAFPNARSKQRRQMLLIGEALAAGQHVAVDNTNPSPEEWHPIITAARSQLAKVTGYWFPPELSASLSRNAAREGKARIPDVGLYATHQRLQRPSLADGFDELFVVRIDRDGGFDVRPMDEDT